MGPPLLKVTDFPDKSSYLVCLAQADDKETTIAGRSEVLLGRGSKLVFTDCLPAAARDQPKIKKTFGGMNSGKP